MEFLNEARLTNPWLAYGQHQLAVPLPRPLPAPHQHGDFLVATHKGREPALPGALLVKVAERRATLLGLNPPIGHAVAVIQHPPTEQPNSTDRILAVLDRIAAPPKPDEPESDPEALH